MKNTWKHWVSIDDKGNGRYYHFNTFKVYWAYRWYTARELDRYMAVTPIKTKAGYIIEKGDYEHRYLKEKEMIERNIAIRK